ncbi:hypothetical protein D1007_30821 [Hordeum vulgare]|nr:hypothetical protein D1007_30821 [Hordeum vulgare]
MSGRRRISGCVHGGVGMQHRCGKDGEQPWVKTDGGMRGGAKADGVALDNIGYGAVATRGMKRDAETAPGSATSDTSATFSGA